MHTNLRDPNIKLTIQPETNDRLAFLDTCVHIKDDGSAKVTIYRKPTRTDQYLNFDSNHHLVHKRSFVITFFHHTYTVISEEEDMVQEIEHLKCVLRDNNCKSWILIKMPEKQRGTKNRD